MRQTLDRHPGAWLALGSALTVAANMRWGMGVFAWIAPVAILRYLRLGTGWQSRCAVLVGLVLAWTLTTLKIVTSPIPLVVAPGWGLPLGLLFGSAYLVGDWIRRRTPQLWVPAFAALVVVAEWLLHALTPLGSWGAAAYTQVEQLALLQLAAVTGLHGVSYLIYAFAGALEDTLHHGWRERRRQLGVVVCTTAAVIALGQARLVHASGKANPVTLVAAVGTTSTIKGLPLPTRAEMARVDEGLFSRTRKAAAAGAKLVVWTEASTLVFGDDEPAWQSRVQALALETGVPIVAAYIVPLSDDPLRYENKYIWVLPDGRIDHTYYKNHPVPGEPATPGPPHVATVESDGFGPVAGAICYDFDFPRLAAERGAAGVSLVALPSSDWRGIDPIHTQMAAMRAIENGFSVLRSTRWGLSAGVDPYGRIRGWLSSFDDEDERILLVHLPRDGVVTPFRVLGDWFVLVCGMLVVFSVARRPRDMGIQVP